MRRYDVRVKKKIARELEHLPTDVQRLLYLLISDLQANGPIQKSWKNFSSLGKNRYHCHLTYRYVACWMNDGKEIVIEVYYVGTREKAPY